MEEEEEEEGYVDGNSRETPVRSAANILPHATHTRTLPPPPPQSSFDPFPLLPINYILYMVPSPYAPHIHITYIHITSFLLILTISPCYSSISFPLFQNSILSYAFSLPPELHNTK